MSEYYFSCGQIHSHHIGGGKIWNKNNLLKVVAETPDLAIEKVSSFAGKEWGAFYSNLPENWRTYWKEIIEL